MKAIKCSQCGAIISEFSSEDEFASCSYCNAKFRMRDAKIKDIPRKEVKRINARVEKYSFDVQEIVDKDYGPSPKVWLALACVLFFVVIGGFWMSGYQHGSKLFGIDQPDLEYSVTAQTNVSSNVYNAKDYNPLQFDKLEFPTFYSTGLHNYQAKDITEKILAERTVKVATKVDKNGKVFEAKALNGHEYLKKVCEQAALKSSFFPPVNEDVTIIYRFKVIN